MATKNSIDNIKNYWDKRPCNIKHSVKKIGTIEYFLENEKRRYFVEPHIINFAEFDKYNGKKVLEIGCGIGVDGVNFARNGADYSTIDLSGKSLEIAKLNFQVNNLNANFYQGNSEYLEDYIPLQKFDLIYSFGVIHHSAYPAKILESVKKYMHKDTEFKLMLYARNSWKYIMMECGYEQMEAQEGVPKGETYTKEEAKSFLSDFEIIEFNQHHIFPYKIDKYIQYEYEIQPWFKTMPSKMFAALNEHLGWHLLINCKYKS